MSQPTTSDQAETQTPAPYERDEEADEALSELFQDTPEIVAESAWSTGQRLLDAFIDELTAAGVRQSDETKFILDRLARRIKTELRVGYLEILSGGTTAVPAELKKVVFQADKVEGTLTIDKNTQQRHELADFAGSDVLVVMVDDVEDHLADMDEMVKEASEMQGELPLLEPVEIPPELEEEAVPTNGITVEEKTLPERAPDETEPAQEIDESRLLLKDGEVVGMAPDPDCAVCSGNGGWDMNVPDPEGGDEPVQEWVRCDCVELPA